MERLNDGSDPAALAAAMAAHRFGLGEASLAIVGAEPKTWLLGQIAPADPQRGSRLPTLAEGLRSYTLFVQNQRRPQHRRIGGRDIESGAACLAQRQPALHCSPHAVAAAHHKPF